MSTCKDCLHYYACSAKGGLFNEKDESKEMLCGQFQDKFDYAPVVRCKDCEYSKLDLMEKGLVVCRRPVLKNGQLLPFNWETKYTDFCSFGIRKGGAE